MENKLKQIVINYFETIDSGNFNEDYYAFFSEDIVIDFPKFGSAKGIEGLSSFGVKMSGYLNNLQHNIEKANIMVVNNCVIVEGILTGETKSKIKWPDNKISFGKFCTVFEFDEKKMKRISIYADPDFASQDIERLKLLKL